VFAVLAATALVWLNSPWSAQAHAYPVNHAEEITLPLTQEGGSKISTLDQDWKVGNCVMVRGARVEFRPDGTVRFTGQAYSTATSFDLGIIHVGENVWHQYFMPLDPNGRQLSRFYIGKYRLPENGSKLPDSPAGVDITLKSADVAKNFQFMTKVIWRGQC
jgi:hypothetical protein